MDIHSIHGLSADEVTQKQKTSGYNELPDREKKNFLKIIMELLSEPMIFLLVAIVVVYFSMGDRSEATVLALSVVVIMGIELYQNAKTEKALEALRGLSSPNCEVIRDSAQITLPSRELVVGDMIVVSEGSRVPADATLLSAHNLMVDESLLTGESMPVEKNETDDAENVGRHVFSGTMVVKGHGIAEVTAIGKATEIGKIGSSLQSIKPEKTLLEQEVARVVKTLASVAVAASIILALVYWLTRDDLLHGFLAGLTLSIAVLPEEFPIVLTVFMALGAWRLAKSNVLARKSRTIETLGSATVLCTDKTGTLTENRMTIEHIISRDGVQLNADQPAYREIVECGVLASQINPFDPMEEAFIRAGNEANDNLDAVYDGNRIIKEYPLEESSLSVVHVWGDAAGVQKAVALKGAPETVFALCHVTTDVSDNLQKVIHENAGQGLRVLAVARGRVREDIPASRDEYEYELLGLVALADPIRSEAAPAVALCRQAGIRVIMITGDYAETARRIGSEIGLDSEIVVTGDEFSQMSDSERIEAVKTTSIFSRVIPAHKLLIVNALKANGEVVAMTGDGVNDAPALKSAHIGIAMGERGTDVAREAASIVLLDDNFASVVRGVRLGRRIFDNLQKAMVYILTVHAPIITLSLLPVFFGWPLVLLPIHIVFLEFIIDPSCTLIFEGEEEDESIMDRPPRQLNSPLFSRQMVLLSAATGFFIAFVVVLGHWLMLTNGWSNDKARAVTFLMIVLTNVLLILAVSGRRVVARSFTKPTAMSIVVSIVVVSISIIYTVEPVRELFKFAPLTILESMVAIVVAVSATLVVVPIRKLVAHL